MDSFLKYLPKSTVIYDLVTGKSFSEALILAKTNLKYDKRLFLDLPVQYMKTTSAEHGQNMARTCSV